jgi:hypothetical protein
MLRPLGERDRRIEVSREIARVEIHGK